MHQQPLSRQLSFFVILRVVLHASYAMLLPLLPIFARGLDIDMILAARAISISQLANVLVPIVSLLTERRGYRFGMLLGLGVFTAGTGLILIAQSYPVFVVTTFLATLGVFIFLPSQQAYFSGLVPYETRGRVLAISEMGWAASMIVGVPVIAFLIERSGNWLISYGTLCLLASLFFVVIALTFRPALPASDRKTHFFAGFEGVFKKPLAWAGIILSMILMPSVNLVGTVYGYWLEDTFGLHISELGAASMVMGFAFAAGTFGSALLTDRLGKTRAIFIGFALNCLVGLYVVFTNPGLTAALIWIFLFYVTAEFAFISALTMLTELVPEYRTTFLAATTATSGLGGAIAAYLSPLLYQNGFHTNVLAVIIVNLFVTAYLWVMTRKFSLAGGAW